MQYFGLSMQEIRRFKEIGYDVYSCGLTRQFALPFMGVATSVVWLVVPTGSPVEIQFTDCETLKVQ